MCVKFTDLGVGFKVSRLQRMEFRPLLIWDGTWGLSSGVQGFGVEGVGFRVERGGVVQCNYLRQRYGVARDSFVLVSVLVLSLGPSI